MLLGHSGKQSNVIKNAVQTKLFLEIEKRGRKNHLFKNQTTCVYTYEFKFLQRFENILKKTCFSSLSTIVVIF